MRASRDLECSFIAIMRFMVYLIKKTFEDQAAIRNDHFLIVSKLDKTNPVLHMMSP